MTWTLVHSHTENITGALAGTLHAKNRKPLWKRRDATTVPMWSCSHARTRATHEHSSQACETVIEAINKNMKWLHPETHGWNNVFKTMQCYTHICTFREIKLSLVLKCTGTMATAHKQKLVQPVVALTFTEDATSLRLNEQQTHRRRNSPEKLWKQMFDWTKEFATTAASAVTPTQPQRLLPKKKTHSRILSIQLEAGTIELLWSEKLSVSVFIPMLRGGVRDAKPTCRCALAHLVYIQSRLVFRVRSQFVGSLDVTLNVTNWKGAKKKRNY